MKDVEMGRANEDGNLQPDDDDMASIHDEDDMASIRDEE